MKIIDRYILEKFLKTFFFTVLLSSAVSVVFDFSEKVQKLAESGIDAWPYIREYYILFIFLFIITNCLFFILFIVFVIYLLYIIYKIISIHSYLRSYCL